MRVALRLSILVLPLLFAAGPAGGGVRIVPPFELERYADEAALGWLVPGAGPEVTRAGALAALLRGELEHDLLGGVAEGENLIELDAPGGPVILVSLPPEGRSANDRRYPIALLGAEGLLTSDSTRIDGLVSITDVATGRLRTTASSDPVAALERLDERIDRNDSLRLPLTLLLAAALVVLAVVRPPLALRALLVALAANLLLSPWLALAAVAAAVLLPLGLACAAILAAYLVVARPRRRDRGALAARPLPVGPLLRDQQPARDDAPRARAARHGAARPGGSARCRPRTRRRRGQPLRRRRRRSARARGRARRARAAPERRPADGALGGGSRGGGRRRGARTRRAGRVDGRREPRHGGTLGRARRARRRPRGPGRALRAADTGEPRRARRRARRRWRSSSRSRSAASARRCSMPSSSPSPSRSSSTTRRPTWSGSGRCWPSRSPARHPGCREALRRHASQC